MSGVYEWGIQLIRQVQSVRSPVLELLFRGITFLGNEEFFLLLFPLLYWCLDSRLGFRLGVLFFVSGYANFLLKNAFAQPRPFELAPGINIIKESGYGLPSGHAQSAVVLWGMLAYEAGPLAGRASAQARAWRKVGLWAAAMLLMLLIGLSRVYLGVHFPTDVLGGWLIGVLILAAAILILRALSEVSMQAHFLVWIGLINLITAITLLVLATKDTVTVLAAFWGFANGYVFLSRFFSPSTAGTPVRRLLRLPAGMAVLLGLYLGLKALFPAEGAPLYLVFRFARYGLIGFWGAFGAPLFFRLLRLEQ